MPKKREKSEGEFYRSEIRRLKKVIRSLEQEVRALKKYEHQYEISQDEEVETSEEDTHTVLKKLQQCDNCGKGYYNEFEIIGRVIGTCNICGDRKRIK
jgi:hypothetical protein